MNFVFIDLQLEEQVSICTNNLFPFQFAEKFLQVGDVS